ncbi:MAG: hypothetical protein ACUVSL_08415 [Chloroflexus sp.]|uniref:hypothetical protein n=1 Tax=Chloroflexus sp. TaxID=1904827 RepID=UPI004049883E
MLNYTRYLISALLWFFLNPFGFWQGMMQVFGQVVAVGRSLFAHSTNSKQPTVLSLPFEGYWTVANGGVDKKHAHSWSVIAQRYAYDFYVTDDEGKSFLCVKLLLAHRECELATAILAGNVFVLETHRWVSLLFPDSPDEPGCGAL